MRKVPTETKCYNESENEMFIHDKKFSEADFGSKLRAAKEFSRTEK
jgi:hypothetical protein